MISIYCFLILASVVNGDVLDTFSGGVKSTIDHVGQTIQGVQTGTKGIVGVIPELITDSFGNVLDINNMPDVPWEPVPQLIEKQGYKSEIHTVTTSDGYILSVHRIPHAKNGFSNGKVVYLQHGLLAASSDWVLLGPKNGLAYILADKGYDVWMGNCRGNLYSKKHNTLSPKSKEFWQFSWHEIGIYDITAIIDYILLETHSSQLYHVGHSQGTTSFYVMTSMKPDYNKKVKVHISLAPVAYMNHLQSPLLQIASFGTLPLDVLLKLIGQYEFLPNEGFLNMLTDTLCSEGIGKVLCKNAMFALMGFSPKQMNVTNIPLIMAHYPAGAATKQVVHYGQEVRSGKFEQFDYFLENYKMYKALDAPDYKLANIVSPVHLLYASNDWMAAVVDVLRLSKELPNCRELYNIPIQTFNHLDFLFANDAPKVVYQKVIEILEKY